MKKAIKRINKAVKSIFKKKQKKPEEEKPKEYIPGNALLGLVTKSVNAELDTVKSWTIEGKAGVLEMKKIRVVKRLRICEQDIFDLLPRPIITRDGKPFFHRFEEAKAALEKFMKEEEEIEKAEALAAAIAAESVESAAKEMDDVIKPADSTSKRTEIASFEQINSTIRANENTALHKQSKKEMEWFLFLSLG